MQYYPPNNAVLPPVLPPKQCSISPPQKQCSITPIKNNAVLPPQHCSVTPITPQPPLISGKGIREEFLRLGANISR